MGVKAVLSAVGSVPARLVLLGVFLGFVLIDLAFDVESARGRYDTSKDFYFGRQQHDPRSRFVLLALPLGLLLLVSVAAVLGRPSWANGAGMLCVLAANACGSFVIGQRVSMDEWQLAGAHAVGGEAEAEAEIERCLVRICYAHFAMLPILVAGAVFTSRDGPVPAAAAKSKSQ